MSAANASTIVQMRRRFAVSLLPSAKATPPPKPFSKDILHAKDFFCMTLAGVPGILRAESLRSARHWSRTLDSLSAWNL